MRHHRIPARDSNVVSPLRRYSASRKVPAVGLTRNDQWRKPWHGRPRLGGHLADQRAEGRPAQPEELTDDGTKQLGRPASGEAKMLPGVVNAEISGGPVVESEHSHFHHFHVFATEQSISVKERFERAEQTDRGLEHREAVR